jgi:RHS repeat-associated protein
LTIYLYDGLNAIMERDLIGNTRAYYTRGLSYGGGIGSIISALREEGRFYYHYDGIGGITGLTDSTGKTVQTYTYDAFGNILQVDSYLKGKQTVTNPYRFSTKEYNSRSGLIYFGARYYDPKIGRFITPDPLTWGPDDPRVLISHQNNFVDVITRALIQNRGSFNPELFHRYTYCLNNPLNLMEPWGWTPVQDPLKDPNIKNKFERAWKNSYPYDSSKRHEEGGWIVKDKNGNFQVKPWPSGKTASINPTPKPSNAVGHYHTHPNYGTGGGGIKGPSDVDIKFTKKHGVPGYIIDKESIIKIDPKTGKWGEVQKR